jgi:hypothetical protein
MQATKRPSCAPSVPHRWVVDLATVNAEMAGLGSGIESHSIPAADRRSPKMERCCSSRALKCRWRRPSNRSGVTDDEHDTAQPERRSPARGCDRLGAIGSPLIEVPVDPTSSSSKVLLIPPATSKPNLRPPTSTPWKWKPLGMGVAQRGHVADRARDDDATRFGQHLDAFGIEAVAEDVMTCRIYDDLAEMNADADQEALLLGEAPR